MCGVFLDANFHGGSNDTIGGRGRLRRPEIWPIYPLQLSPFLGSFPPPWRPVLVTGNKFIAGVVVTGDNCSPVSLSRATKLSPVSLSLVTKLLPVLLSPVINCSPVSTTPAITENLWQRLIAGVNDTGNKFFAMKKLAKTWKCGRLQIEPKTVDLYSLHSSVERYQHPIRVGACSSLGKIIIFNLGLSPFNLYIKLRAV